MQINLNWKINEIKYFYRVCTTFLVVHRNLFSVGFKIPPPDFSRNSLPCVFNALCKKHQKLNKQNKNLFGSLQKHFHQ